MIANLENDRLLLAQSCYVLLKCVESLEDRLRAPSSAELRLATRYVSLAIGCLRPDASGTEAWVKEACNLVAKTQARAMLRSGPAAAPAQPATPAQPSAAAAAKRAVAAGKARGLHGDTSTVAIPDLLSWLGMQERDGVLYVNIPGEEIVVYLDGGNVVHAVSDHTPDDSRLGEILVSQGTLTSEQLQEVIAGLQAGGGCLGALLKEQGLVTEEALHSALQLQIGRLFNRMFGADLAEFTLVEGLPRTADGQLNLNLMGLLLDAARSTDEARHGGDEVPAGKTP
ncbi:MAG: DUF4388 domain-containing protein [Planctomycetes bacterium]|nr:DUF4388 domain-containing protein [Planctomycetota bacterium]MCB9871720.1 DUF4388 domain-containing protein [Planctomycetota bacterium]